MTAVNTIIASNQDDWKHRVTKPTANGVEVWNYARREQMRASASFKSRNLLWTKSTIPGTPNHRFPAYSRVGKLMKELNKLQPTSYDEWAVHYLRHVCSWDRLQMLAGEWWAFCQSSGSPISKEEALAEHIVHVLDESYEGYEAEQTARKALEAYYSSPVKEPAYKWDADYAIDLIVEDRTAPDGFTLGFQIKPRSFFLGTHPSTCVARQENAQKHAAAEALGKTPFFLMKEDFTQGIIKPIHHTELKLS